MRSPDGRGLLARVAVGVWALLAAPVASSTGRTPGSFAVSPTGEAQYSIPIFAPPGVNGLTPELALTYGHHHEGTLAGIGWGISGLSTIYRCEKTWAQNNGVAEAPQNETDDRYCLDGNQLRHYSGTYGAPGSTYRSEIETYARITALGPSAGNGPGGFKVEHKNGLVYEYGITADSQILSLNQPEARAWALSRISDRSGNAITVTWHNDTQNGSFRIDQIDYVNNSIFFEWESKPATEVNAGFVTGSPVQEIHRLRAIEVQQGGSAIRRYDLSYEAALSSTRKSRLASIEECAGTLCRPATTFAYQSGSAGLQSEVNTTRSAPSAVSSYFPLDVNGDGREDLVYVTNPGGTGTWQVMFANASGGYNAPVNSGQSNANYLGAIPIDYNQDGLGDVLVPYNGTHWYVMLGSSSGLGALTLTGTQATPSGRGENARALDVDGDGRQDLVWADLYGFETGGDAIRYRLRNASGGGFGADDELVGPYPVNSMLDWGVFYGWAQKQPGKAPDFNGDGRGDIIYEQVIREFHPLTGWNTQRTLRAKCAGDGCFFSKNLPGGASPPTFGDFNGDGLTDIFFYSGPTQIPNNSAWWYALSRGTDFAAAVSVGNANAYSTEHVILDWDADGRDDVLAQYASGSWALNRANGLGFDGWVNLTGSFPTSSTPMAVTDIDGDGLHDFVYAQGGTWRYRKHSGLRPDLLTSVTDGYGNTVSITYAALTSSGVHSKTTAAYPEQSWQGSMMVVTRHTASDGIGGTYSVDHTYAGAKLNLQGRGFEGFSKHTSVDDRNGVKTDSYFMQAFPHTGSPDMTEVRQSGNALIGSIDYAWSTKTPSGGVESRTFPFASTVTEKTYGVGATLNGTLLATVVTDTTMDAATGTPTEVKVTTTEAAGVNGIRPNVTWTERTVHTNLTNHTAGGDWCIGRPQRTDQINLNSTAYGSEQTRTLATTWDADFCRPTEQVLEPDIAQWRLEVDLAYDGFGNLRQQTVGDGTGPLLNRIWETTFTADGRFPLTVKNPLNEVTQLTFDARFGLPLTETDPNGLVTSFIYDGFGRATRETRPDQTRTDIAYAACGTGCGQTVTAQQKTTGGGVIRTDYAYFDDFDRLYATRTQLLGGGYSLVVREYDELGRLKTDSAPCPEGTPGTCLGGIYRTTFTYDLIGRPTQISRPFSPIAPTTQTTTIAYAGLRATITDPLSKLSVRTQDARGRLARSADHAGYAQTFEYDAFGNPVRVSDGTSTLQSATFNVRGLRETATDADLGTWEYVYNAFGELTRHTDANDVPTDYKWDPLGRPTERKMPEGAGFITRTWIWGALADNTASAKYVGRLKESMVAGTGVHTYREVHSYDAKGRPVQTAYWQNTTNIGLVNLAYEPTTGLVDSLTYPESTAQYRLKLKYDYEGGLLKRVKDFNAPTTVFWEATTMDAYGQIIDETLGGVLKTIRGVEPRTGFIESIQSGPLADTTARQNLEYVWDLAGNLKSREDHRQSLKEEFAYDHLHRLVTVKLNTVPTLTLSYSFNGNIASKSDMGTYTYHPTKVHALTSISGTTTQSFDYDANGNMTDRNGAELRWFADNSLKRIRLTPGSASNSSELQYGPDGQQWYHKMNAGGTIYTHVNLGGIFEIVAKGAIDDFRHTIHANGVPVALYSRKSTGANTLRYLLRDHLGSVDVIATSAGAEELQLSFDEFGDQRDPADWNGPIPGTDLAAVREITRRGYTDHNQLRDGTGIIHMQGRVYGPGIGRFLSADPFIDGITNTQGWNRYSYVGNNPLSYVDPSGYVGVPAGGADGPPESGPDQSSFGVCLGFGVGRTCGPGVQDNARHSDFYGPRHRPAELTWAQAIANIRRTVFSKGGTANFMPNQGLAPTREDFGSTVGGTFSTVAHVTLNAASIGLDATGVGALVSWVPDILDAGLSTIEGDFTGAGISLAAAVPGVGNVANVTKLGIVGAKSARAATEMHHLLPQAVRFRKFFERAGLNIEDFRIPLDAAKHRLNPGGVHTNSGGNWNRVWDDFFKGNPNATRQEILDQLASMRRDFGI
jgi:RHS repeat-associated protein